MRKTSINILTSVILATSALISCKKDETLVYNSVMMGNIYGESIISDHGNTLDIVESTSLVDFNRFEYGRVIIACDVLQKTDNKRYDIRLIDIESVLTKETVKASTITDPESEFAVEDAIIIKDMSYSGGYLNMLIQFAQKKNSNTAHFINLIYEDNSDEEGYSFILRHNAYGEVPKENEAYVSASGYVSFPLANLIEGDKTDLIIKWKSHKKYDNGEYSLYDTEPREITLKWERTGYEHQATTIRTTPDFRSIAK